MPAAQYHLPECVNVCGATAAAANGARLKVENSILSRLMLVANSDIPILLRFHLYPARVVFVCECECDTNVSMNIVLACVCVWR